MTGLWLENQELRLRRDLATPTPPAGEALVAVRVTGICNTDLELTRGYYPFAGIPGHEFVGTVMELGPPPARPTTLPQRPTTLPDRTADDLVGHRVVGEINAVCHECATCRAGLESHCERRTVLGIVGRDGAFAEHLLLPIENLHAVPDTVPDEVAVFVEPLAAALEIQQQVDIDSGARVLIVGDGKLGQLVARTLALVGCDLRVIGKHVAKLRRLEELGIGVGHAGDLRPGIADVAIECTGNPEGFELARRALRPRGTLVMKSTYAGSLSLDAAAVVVDELTLIGSRCGPFAPALELLESGAVVVDDLVDARYSLEEAGAAFEYAERPGVLKVLIDVSAGDPRSDPC